LYLLESYGRKRWGRLMAFLFVWQFMLSGPLEIASGLIAIAIFVSALDPDLGQWNKAWTWKWLFWPEADLSVSMGPPRLLGLGGGRLIVFLLYRRIRTLGHMTVVLWLGVLAVIGWILVEGLLHFDPATAFDYCATADAPVDFETGLGGAMLLA